MEAPQDAGHGLHSREPHSTPDNVDDAAVTTPGENNKAPATHIHHHSLVVKEVRFRFPAAFAFGLEEREPLLEVRHARNFARDKQGVVEEERWVF